MRHKKTTLATRIKKFFSKKVVVVTTTVILLGGLAVGSVNLYTNAPGEILLTTANSITLGEINDQSANYVIQQLEARKADKQIYLFIKSPGGYVSSGYKIIEALKKTNNVTCVAQFAASMAFSILQQGCKTRLVTDNAILMQHHIGISGSFTLPDLKRLIPEMEQMEDGLHKGDSQRLGLTMDEFRKILGYELWLKGAKAILALKAADGVVKVIQQQDFTERQLAGAPSSN